MSRPEQSEPAGGEPRSHLWATVLADLRLRLASGEFDERFPTDRELMDRYGVSRHTAREAVRRLEVVDRRPRLGGRIRRPAGTLENLGLSLRALGVELTLSGSGRVKRRSADVAGILGVDASQPIPVFRHVLRADGQPLLMSELWVAPQAGLDAADVERLLGLRPAEGVVAVGDESVLPVVATGEARLGLELPAGAAVFCAEQHVEVGGRTVAWHRAFIRPERYRCIVRWDPTADGA